MPDSLAPPRLPGYLVYNIKQYRMKVGIVAYDGCTPSMIVGVMDIFAFASSHYQASDQKDLFDISIITETGLPANGFSKFAIHAQRSIKTKSEFDLIYIPGFVGEVEGIIIRQKKLIDWLKKQYHKGVILAAACNGNFILAETGALDRKKATTHWSLANTFRQRYSQITVEPEKILIDNGQVISAAGVTAYLNLAIFLVGRYGSKDLALASAKIFLVDSGRKIQTPYQMFHVAKNHGDDEVVQVQEWLEANYSKAITLEEMTHVCNLTKKTLTRRFRKVTGDSPMSYLQKLRVENAKRLLESEKVAFNEVTWRVGYNDISSFHKVFKSETGLTPTEYRSKFSLV
jgi:transcriptional regulator GlxA family with amidase domain